MWVTVYVEGGHAFGDPALLWALSQDQTLQGLAQQTGTPISTISDRLRRAWITLGAKTAAQALAEAVRKQLI